MLSKKMCKVLDRYNHFVAELGKRRLTWSQAEREIYDDLNSFVDFKVVERSKKSSRKNA